MNLDPAVLATEDEQKRGWRIATHFLKQVRESAAANHNQAVPIDQIEAVLLAANRLLIERVKIKR